MSHCDFAPTEDVNRIERARRALVYVTVDWSMPERHARAVVRAAIDAIPPALDRAGVAFPPGHVVLLGLKDERRLEVYAGPAEDALRHVADYPVVAASGSPGPK